MDDRRHLAIEAGDGPRAINEEEVGRVRQLRHGATHRFKTGAQDIDRVNRRGLDDADADGAVGKDFLEGAVAGARGQALGIINADGEGLPVEYDGAGHDRAGQRTAARLVNSRDPEKPLAPELPVERL